MMDSNFKLGGYTFHSHPGFVKLSPHLIRISEVKISEIKKLRNAPIGDMIFNTTGFEPITTDLDCGGYFDAIGQRIAIRENSKYAFQTFCHEMGHWIHLEAGIDYHKTELLSDQVRFEQEAEAIGKRIYEAVTRREYKNIVYFNHEEIQWLADWYGDWYQNDLTKCA